MTDLHLTPPLPLLTRSIARWRREADELASRGLLTEAERQQWQQRVTLLGQFDRPVQERQ